jgi:hypothetical protein
MTGDSTLGGYFETHQRPPAFEGTDGRAYSVAIYVDEAENPKGRFAAALLFVRWTAAGDQPEGHLETGYLAFGDDAAEVEQSVRALTLHDVKDHLEALIVRARDLEEW